MAHIKAQGTVTGSEEKIKSTALCGAEGPCGMESPALLVCLARPLPSWSQPPSGSQGCLEVNQELYVGPGWAQLETQTRRCGWEDRNECECECVCLESCMRTGKEWKLGQK